MAAQVISLFRSLTSRDWTQAELAQFYRVESALIQAGMAIETDRGLSDEGDPWFVFCRADDGEVFIHFARIGGEYIAVGAAMEQVVHGKDFRALVEEMLEVQSFVMARSSRKNTNLFLHPAALLIALVGSAFFHSSHAKAAETQGHQNHPEGRRALFAALAKAGGDVVAFEAADNATVLSAVLTANMGLDRAVAATSSTPHTVEIAASALAAALNAAEATTRASAIPASSPALDHSAGAHALPVATEAAVAALLANHDIVAPPSVAPAAFLVVDHLGSDTPAWITQISAAPAVPAASAAPVAAFFVLESTTQAAEALQAAHVLPEVQAQPLAISPALLEAALKAIIGHGSGDLVTVTDDVRFLLGDGADTQGSGATPSSPPASDPGATSSPPDTVADSPTPPPAPPVPPAAPVLSGLTPNSPFVIAAIQHFSAEVTTLDIANVAHNMVLYDGSLFSTTGPLPALDSVTFTFTDGSTISLVGSPAEIQALHLFSA